MKPIIGILGRPDCTKSNREVTICYDSIKNMIQSLGGIPFLILPPKQHYQEIQHHLKEYQPNEDIQNLLTLCDGIVLQGGSFFYDYDLAVAAYAYEHDLPTLGICLGMQTMAVMKKGEIKNISTPKEIHQSTQKYSHPVNIDKNSKLYSILETSQLMVNSRHQEQIIKTDLEVVGNYQGIIEAVEAKGKKFFIGVQWHPEDLFEYDIVNKKLLVAFMDTCREEMYANKRNDTSRKGGTM